MATIVNSVGKWPFPAVTEARKGERDEWVEIDEECRYELLEALPPIYLRSSICGFYGFMMGEPAAHAEDGEPIRAAVISVGERHFVRELPKSALYEAVCGLKDSLAV